MRTTILPSAIHLVLLAALPVASVACGDDSGSGGAGGAGGGATTSTTTSTSTTSNTTTTSTTSTTTSTSTATSTSTGMVDCVSPIEITAGAFALRSADGAAANYAAAPSPDLGDVEEDQLAIELYGSAYASGYNGEDTGSFDLTMNADDNYGTCSRCLLYFEDPTSSAGRIFFTQTGTLEIDATSTQLDGALTGTLTDVTLVEVTIDPDTFESTPVPNGACLHLATADVSVAPK